MGIFLTIIVLPIIILLLSDGIFRKSDERPVTKNPPPPKC